ncbi:MAG TPA: hypothetical protein VJ950_03330 [Acidimicrobiia bacterium]|nr:hypothetical protein [Acidimicrobiia bacterium]
MSPSLTARREAAESFRPAHVDCLLVAEAPPANETRYFYFETVDTQDSLYLEVSKALFYSLDTERLRANKARYLSRLRDQGMWLVDLAEEPVPDPGAKPDYLNTWVDSLLERCQAIHPRRVILFASSVYDVAFQRLREAGVPVADIRIPFPGSGRQKEFRARFWEALRVASINPYPVVVDGNCVSYWLDALDAVVAPQQEDPLAAQKTALVRIFYYWPWVMSFTPTIRTEIEAISDPARLQAHQKWIDIHMRELLAPNAERLAAAEDELAGSDVNETDARWLCEAIAHDSTLAITWDQPLLNQSAGLNAIEVVSPTTAWNTLIVPNETAARIAPSPTNPLSQQDWWNV